MGNFSSDLRTLSKLFNDIRTLQFFKLQRVYFNFSSETFPCDARKICQSERRLTGNIRRKEGIATSSLYPPRLRTQIKRFVLPPGIETCHGLLTARYLIKGRTETTPVRASTRRGRKMKRRREPTPRTIGHRPKPPRRFFHCPPPRDITL